MIEELDKIIRESISHFVKDIFELEWWGREREAVSLYAFRYLQKSCQNGSILYDPAQIGIEVTVPGVEGLNKKGTAGKDLRVMKDLVIWPSPGMTCWDENLNVTREPIAIMEWKCFPYENKKPKVSGHDRKWLAEYSRTRKDFVGYATTLDLHNRKYRIRVDRIYSGNLSKEWFIY